MADEPDRLRVVAEERCQQRGMTAGDIPRRELGALLLEESERWAALLTDEPGSGMLRRRGLARTCTKPITTGVDTEVLMRG